MSDFCWITSCQKRVCVRIGGPGPKTFADMNLDGFHSVCLSLYPFKPTRKGYQHQKHPLMQVLKLRAPFLVWLTKGENHHFLGPSGCVESLDRPDISERSGSRRRGSAQLLGAPKVVDGHFQRPQLGVQKQREVLAPTDERAALRSFFSFFFFLGGTNEKKKRKTKEKKHGRDRKPSVRFGDGWKFEGTYILSGGHGMGSYGFTYTFGTCVSWSYNFHTV